MQEYIYEVDRENRHLHMRHYIYWVGPYRYDWHEDLELMLILKGRVEMTCGGETLTLEEDDLLLINSNVGHASLAKEEGTIAMVILLDPEYLKDYYYPVRDHLFSGHTDAENRYREEMVEIRGLMASMMAGTEREEPLARLRFEQELNQLLYLLLRVFPPQKMMDTEFHRAKKQLSMMEKILNYVEENYRERISLADLSQLCQYNASYLSTYFKQHVGINFYDYLTRVRLREATWELCSTDNSVPEVAENHGFADTKAFNASFRKAFGMSPKEYRQRVKDLDREIDFSRRWHFLPVDHEAVGQKLARYQRDYLTVRSREAAAAGMDLVRQELAAILTERVEESCRQVQSLQQGLEQMRRQTLELCEMSF